MKAAAAVTPDALQEWADVRDAFRQYIKANSPSKDATIGKYATGVASFSAWCSERRLSLHTVAATDLEAYDYDDGDASALRWLFRLLVSAGARRDNPLSRPVYALRQPPAALSDAWVEDFRLYLVGLALATRTIRGYRYDAIAFRRWCEGRGCNAEQAEKADLLAYVDERRQCTGPASVVRRFAAVRHYHRWLIARAVRSDDPTDGIRLRQPREAPKRPFTRDELRRLFAACRKPQERAAVLLLTEAGLRLSEIAGLRRADIDFDRGLISVRGKGDKERLAAPSARAFDALRLCMDGRDHPWHSQRLHGPMTPDGYYRMLRRLGKRAGVQHVHPHRFRTSFACLFMEESGDILALQLLMGHEKIEVTAHYARWGATQRALSKQASIVRLFSPG